MELRIASDRYLVNCYKSLQKLNEDCEKLRAQLKELEEAALPIDINSSAIFRYAFVVLFHCQRIPHDVGREVYYEAVDQEVWRLSRWLGGLST
jgi:hypothetical protein